MACQKINSNLLDLMSLSALTFSLFKLLLLPIRMVSFFFTQLLVRKIFYKYKNAYPNKTLNFRWDYSDTFYFMIFFFFKWWLIYPWPPESWLSVKIIDQSLLYYLPYLVLSKLCTFTLCSSSSGCQECPTLFHHSFKTLAQIFLPWRKVSCPSFHP